MASRPSTLAQHFKVKSSLGREGELANFPKAYCIRRLDLGQVVAKCSSSYESHMGRGTEYCLVVAVGTANGIESILRTFDRPGMALRELSLEIRVYNCKWLPPLKPIDKTRYIIDPLEAIPKGLRVLRTKVTDLLGADDPHDPFSYHEDVLRKLRSECIRIGKVKIGGHRPNDWNGGIRQWKSENSWPPFWTCEIRATSQK